ncbi:29628_t:CDS:2, partial [Gigaspora margarita]
RYQALTPEETILVKSVKAEQHRWQRQLKKMQQTPTYKEALSYSETFPIELDIGAMNIVCEACGAFHFAGEHTGRELNIFTLCCQKARGQRSQHPANIHLNQELLGFLDQIIQNISPYAQAYKLILRTINGSQQQILDYDNINAFAELRYISPSKAFWRLSEYEIQEKSH